MDMQKQTMRYLKDQCARYPALETQDLLKALHQSVYGCGHFVSDAAADLLEQELASLRPDASVDAEPLDGSFCRLHLGYLRSSGLSSATLLRMFILSAAGPVGSEAQLREKLSALLAAELPIPLEGRAAAVARWEAEGFPVRHHSHAFRAAYHPAYRVIRQEFSPLLPLLAAIDRAMARQAADSCGH